MNALQHRLTTSRRRFLSSLAAQTAAGALLLGAKGEPGAATPGIQKNVSFAFFGDIPYNTLEEFALARIYQSFPGELSFALHVGDIKSGSEDCSDGLITRRFDLIRKCPVPLIMLPGDNEWVDCSRSVAGNYDPVDRLRLWRLLEARDRRADKALNISRQPQWPELSLWRVAQASATFVGLNVPGSYDATSNQNAAMQHRRLRNAANLDWLELAANKAEGNKDKFLFVCIHANVRLDNGPPEAMPTPRETSAPYYPFKVALAKALSLFSGQVIVLYGDSHQYKTEFPWEDKAGRRLMSVQCFGSPFNGSWLKVDIDPSQKLPRISPQAIV